MSYLIQTIGGSLLGQTIADAVAVQTNGKNMKTIANEFPTWDDEDFIMTYPYTKAVGKYPLNDWSASTDQSIISINSMKEQFVNNTVDSEIFAKKLFMWYKHGFPDIGDAISIGVDQKTALACSKLEFLKAPLASTEEIWKTQSYIPDNGALTRNLPFAFVGSLNDVIRNTILGTRITHNDKRCEAASILLNTILWTILQLKKYKEQKNDTSDLNIEKIIQKNVTHVEQSLDNPIHKKEFQFYLNCEFSEINTDSYTDNFDEIHHVFKSMAVALFALRLTEGSVKSDYKRIISVVATTGGDTCINCALSGAFIGAVIGLNNIPNDWLFNVPNRKWINQRIAELKAISVKYT